MTDTEKLDAIRTLADGWGTAAFADPTDSAAQVRGECATLILGITNS